MLVTWHCNEVAMRLNEVAEKGDGAIGSTGIKLVPLCGYIEQIHGKRVVNGDTMIVHLHCNPVTCY